MIWQAGDTYPANVTVRDDDGDLVDPDTLSLNVRDPEGDITTYVYGTDEEVVRDSLGVYYADVEIGVPGMWVFAWSTTNEEQVEGVQIAVSSAPTVGITFCTVADIATRLKRTLTALETELAQMLCELATGEIAAAVDEDADWSSTLTTIHPTLRSVAQDAVLRAMRQAINNPSGASSVSETLGAYSYTERYESSSGGDSGSPGLALALTASEARSVRRAVFGTSTATVAVASIFDEELPIP
jgi:hypothetical protein